MLWQVSQKSQKRARSRNLALGLNVGVLYVVDPELSTESSKSAASASASYVSTVLSQV